MQPSRLITFGKRKFILVFEDVREGESFFHFGPFTQDADIALVHSDSVRIEIEYIEREDLSDFIGGLTATTSKVMRFHTCFEIEGMPNMERAFLCSWQHMYYLLLFTTYEEPFEIMIKTRRNEKDSVDAMRELSEEFMRESWENKGITLIPISDENE